MNFIKFVAKTITGTVIISAVGSFTFITVLENGLSSEAKEGAISSIKNIVRVVSLESNKSNDDKVVNNATETEEIVDSSDNSVDKLDVPDNILTNKNDNFIFVGDFRTVAYKEIVDITKYDFITFISEESKGYEWLNETAIEKLNTRFDTTDLAYNVILNLGINDLKNVDKYINTYNELANKNSKHNFFIVSLNKVDAKKLVENGYDSIENSEIEEFNSKIKSSLSDKIHFIDTYSYFKDKDLETNDGIHYTNDSSNKILDYISEYIKSL